jgi:hypothetical protein
VRVPGDGGRTTTLSTATAPIHSSQAVDFDPNANPNNASGISAGFTYQITDSMATPRRRRR